ncbi:MAG: hypothetical protein V2I97_12560 [Desulfococcaceae bacterium]|jgi:hypothetical protein|nr:hypothetical protein [Desulfococcaceae bacterium]
MSLTQCRECRHAVSSQAPLCPNCGAPNPWQTEWSGFGFEYKSRIRIFSLPLLHISFKYRNRRPVPAVGIISIGQFALGIINISQFGIGILNLSQFAFTVFGICQICLSYSALAQIALVWEKGYGQMIFSVKELLGL